MGILDALGSSLNNPNNAAVMGLAQGLLQASAPHMMTPVSTGQALAMGMQGAQQYKQQAMQSELLNQKLGALQQQQDWAKWQPPNTPASGQANGPAMQTPKDVGVPSGGAQPKDVWSDPLLKHLQQGAMMGIPGASDAASRRFQYLTQYQPGVEKTLTPEEAAKVIPGGLPPGYLAQQNVLTGKINLQGSNPLRTTQGYDPNTGEPITKVTDLRNPPKPPTDNRQAGQPLPGRSEEVAKLLAHYKLQPSAYLMRSPQGQIELARAKEINPNFDATKYNMVQNARTAFATGQQGRAVKAINASVTHMDTLKELGQALDNGNVRMANSIKQKWLAETGSPLPTNFNAARNIVAGEITKAILGTGGTEEDRKAAINEVNNAASWKQLNGVISTWQRLMAGQLDAFKTQYNASIGDGAFDNYLSPAAKRELSNIENKGGQDGWKIEPVQ